MKKRFEQFKRLCLIISSSSVINWILFIILIASMLFGFIPDEWYKFIALFFALEVMFLNANSGDRL